MPPNDDHGAAREGMRRIGSLTGVIAAAQARHRGDARGGILRAQPVEVEAGWVR